METYTHKCIKGGCENTYIDSDPDAYLCDTCVDAKKSIAREIDKKYTTVGQVVVQTDLQKYDSLPKVRGFVKASDIL